MDSKDNKKKESANSAETKKQNQDFQNIPASSEKSNPLILIRKMFRNLQKTNQEKRIILRNKQKVLSKIRRNLFY